MKKLIESMDRIEECGMSEMPSAPMDQGNPVSMNVSLNASGKEHVADLLDMMKNAGLQQAEPVSAKMLSPRMDMERLRDVVDGPKMELPMPKEEGIEEEGYENEPEEEYSDHNTMLKDLSGGLNREKGAYAAAQDGDNAMAVEDEEEMSLEQSIKEKLLAALEAKKDEPAEYDPKKAAIRKAIEKRREEKEKDYWDFDDEPKSKVKHVKGTYGTSYNAGDDEED